MKTKSLVTLRRSAGLASVRGQSAAQLRAKNPALSDKWAAFVDGNRKAIAQIVAAKITTP